MINLPIFCSGGDIGASAEGTLNGAFNEMASLKGIDKP